LRRYWRDGAFTVLGNDLALTFAADIVVLLGQEFFEDLWRRRLRRERTTAITVDSRYVPLSCMGRNCGSFVRFGSILLKKSGRKSK